MVKLGERLDCITVLPMISLGCGAVSLDGITSGPRNLELVFVYRKISGLHGFFLIVQRLLNLRNVDLVGSSDHKEWMRLQLVHVRPFCEVDFEALGEEVFKMFIIPY